MNHNLYLTNKNIVRTLTKTRKKIVYPLPAQPKKNFKNIETLYTIICYSQTQHLTKQNQYPKYIRNQNIYFFMLIAQ